MLLLRAHLLTCHVLCLLRRSLRVAVASLRSASKVKAGAWVVPYCLFKIQNCGNALLQGSCSRVCGSASVVRMFAHSKTTQAARPSDVLDACRNSHIQWIRNHGKASQEIRNSKQDARIRTGHCRAECLTGVASCSLPKQKAHKHKRRIRCHIFCKVKLKTSHTKRLQSQANGTAADKGPLLLHKKATSAM